MSILESVFDLFPSFKFLFYQLHVDQQRNFTRSLAKKSLEQWAFYAGLLKNAQHSTLDTSHWKPPHCFSQKNLERKKLSPTLLKILGKNLFQSGQVAMLTVAGGLGTRLNFHEPKGLLPVTPIQHKPLFQVFAEKLKALQLHYGHPIHWLIMTSEETDQATQDAFASHSWYDEHYLHFFQQGTLPVFQQDSTCTIHSDGSICYHPNGHGGVFRALQDAGLLQKLQDWGLSILSYFQVDNPLVYLGDTLFLGLHQHQQSEFSTKVVQKQIPEERVGVFVQNQDRLQLVEYCDFPPALSAARDKQGRLKCRCGNTAIHLISIDFIQRHTHISLPCHVVQKKVVTWDPLRQEKVELLGYKLEKFIFDALPYAKHSLLWEIAREDEFSPVKNAAGNDSLETCQKDQYQRWARWFKNFYEKQEKSLDETLEVIKNVRLEVSPLFADNFDEFSDAWDRLEQKPEICDGLYLE